MAVAIHYPSDIILVICAEIFSAGLPAPAPTLDPLFLSGDHGIPTGLPSSIPPGYWSEAIARRTLANLCHVNRAWYAGAKPWLWRRLEVRLPRSWLGIVEQVAWDLDEETTTGQTVLTLEESIKAAAGAALSSVGVPTRKDAALELEERILEKLSSPESPIPMELLSPPPSRDPSPRRLRTKSKSPTRWRIMQTICDAVQNVIQSSQPGAYVPTPHDPRPGRHVRHLDFNHFRTIGMRRSVEEGVNSRFVTGVRLEAVLKELPNLAAFGATEYMDGALTLPVLKELLLRGVPSRGRDRTSRGRGSSTTDSSDTEDEDRERRRDCKELEALDLTGCVSAVFVNALSEFVTTQLLPSPNNGEDAAQSPNALTTRFSRVEPEQALSFSGLRRLGMRSVKSVAPNILSPFILALPSLTHLDLSGTRTTPELLDALGKSGNAYLQSLSLGRCVMLTGESINNFLIHSPVASRIRELSLYGDMIYPSPLTTDDLHDIFNFAPCFLSGELTYLDLSSSPLTSDLLLDVCRAQPTLRSLGLSYIPQLELPGIKEFLRTKASNVEVLTLVSTSPELGCGLRMTLGTPRGSVRQAAIALHSQLITPLCTPPFSIHPDTTSAGPPSPPTRLRVVELSTSLLGSLGSGMDSWRIIKSKGGRSWYVDTASGWVADGKEGSVLRRDLEKWNSVRCELDKLADANGNVNTGIGWHARKMEILHGHGMLGREDGLYGAVSFAYQG